jgi:hypothetical protein
VHQWKLKTRVFLYAPCAALAACSSGEELLKAQAGLVNSAAQSLAKVPLPVADAEPVGSPTEIYTRIARGVTACWFGSHGDLKGTHLLHADAEPPARGGRSELVIHEKDKEMPNPRGNRAFRVTITPNGDNATLEIENVRFSLEKGQSMRAQVRRWARNDLTCGDTPKTEGWDAQHKAPEEPTKPRPQERKI